MDSDKEEPEVPRLAAQLAERYGQDIDPGISLNARPGATSADASLGASGEILTRLEAHSVKKKRYKLDGEIARGGMGAILKVWDEDLRRNLAMKVVLAEADSKGSVAPADLDPRKLSRFLEEAQVTSQLDHPGIVPVHELGLDEEGHVYFTMRLVRGRELKRIFELVHAGEEDWTITRALGVLLKVCEAMGFAHAKGVIHRDLKPANIMVGRYGEVYVMDWGLARVLGREYAPKDKQAPDPALSIVHSERRDDASATADSELYTMDGEVVGTPAFMSPEQARGELGELDARSDVYSMGAMLYHLLSGRVPFMPPTGSVSPHRVLMFLLEGPPKPLSELTTSVPAELVAICEKAMARDAKERYANMIELAVDLRAFLEHRVVKAYRTGAVAEFRKWTERNRGLAATVLGATLLIVSGSIGASAVLAGKNSDLKSANLAAGVARGDAEAARTRAELNAERALLAAEDARRERSNVLRLSAFQELEDLQAAADRLWPAAPENIASFEAWLARARDLLAGIEPRPERNDPGHAAQLAALRSRALPWTPEEQARDRRAHSRATELRRLDEKLLSLRRARARREGRGQPIEAALDKAALAYDGNSLNSMAWSYVDPQRTQFGKEAEGLALARAALEVEQDSRTRALIYDTLAFALLANGLDDEALEASALAIESAAEDEKEEFTGYLEEMRGAVDAARGEAGQLAIEALETERDAVLAELSQRRTYSFVDEEDRWWHSQLVKLVDEFAAFADPETGLVAGTSPRFGWGIERRLTVASEVERRTRTSATAEAAWSETVAAIGDRSQCPAYDGLVLAPQRGLLPIGRDPRSGFFEFAHVQSGDVPERDADGRLVLTADTCLVLVLIPGGKYFQGDQSTDPDAPNYLEGGAEAVSDPVREVTLSPFLISKYELTQAQWIRLTGANPSRHDIGVSHSNVLVTPRNPVEWVSYNDCMRVLPRHELTLPTEAQWEYAARAGTSTPWWSGPERTSLADAENLEDSYWARRRGLSRETFSFEEWDDGHAVHAPVGSFRPNPFGLFDTLGNVEEWCLDAHDAQSYFDPFVVDPLIEQDAPRLFVTRGGSFLTTAFHSRAAQRGNGKSDFKQSRLGVRPARAIED